jgi:predicted DNA-binding protein (MmcQ/YjbR family)
MDAEQIRRYNLSKKGSDESFPFDETTLVFKVMGKMFCLLNLEPPISINLKADPDILLELIERHEFVKPGYHMNKKHWMTVDLSARVKPDMIYEWIDNSYELVILGLPKKLKEELKKVC